MMDDGYEEATWSTCLHPGLTLSQRKHQCQNTQIASILITKRTHPGANPPCAGVQVIDNSAHGANSRRAARPDDLIYVAHVPEGEDAADYLDSVLGHDSAPPCCLAIVYIMFMSCLISRLDILSCRHDYNHSADGHDFCWSHFCR